MDDQQDTGYGNMATSLYIAINGFELKDMIVDLIMSCLQQFAK